MRPAPTGNSSAAVVVTASCTTSADMKEFGGRQSETCAVGSQVAAALGHRAQAGAKMLYEFLNEQLGPNDTGGVTKTVAGKAIPMPAARPSQHTLTPADLTPAWRGPQPHREARRDRPA